MTEERIRELESAGFDQGRARLIWHPCGAYNFNKCANSRPNAATASCHNGTLPTPSSGSGFHGSTATTSCIRKESQVPWQALSVFERSMLLVSTGGQARLILGAYDLNNCVNTRSSSATVSCQQDGTLPTPSSGCGFRNSANTKNCITKGN